jgi:hypothetical protein
VGKIQCSFFVKQAASVATAGRCSCVYRVRQRGSMWEAAKARAWRCGIQETEDLAIVIEIDVSSGTGRCSTEGTSTGMPLVHCVGLCLI